MSPAPSTVEGLIDLAQRHLAAREWGLAARCFAEANRLDGGAPLPRAGLGRVALSVGRGPAARRLLDAVLAEHPTCVEALVARGMLEDQSGRTEEALSLYRRAHGLEPDSAEAAAGVGLALARLGRWHEARPALAAAIRRLPEPGLMAAYAVAAHRDGDTSQALAVLCHAVARHPNHAGVIAALSDLLVAVGQRATAVELLDNALARRPEARPLQSRRQALA